MTYSYHYKKFFTVAEYMQSVMNNGLDGYYNTVHEIGRHGDFVTAPMLTNLFGQTIAQWLIDAWYKMGQPFTVDLIELGPGTGLLLADMVNHLRTVPDLFQAIHIKCVEINSHFKKRIHDQLPDITIQFYDDDTVLQTSHPLFVVANEFLDALPIHQFIYTNKGWFERLVTVIDSQLAFDVDYNHTLQQFLEKHHLTNYYDTDQDNHEIGTILELCPHAFCWVNKISRHINDYGGAAIFIDYGTMHDGYGDTLQAVYQHQKIPLITSPHYPCDLSAHVDFYRLHRIIQHQSLAKILTTQREFLLTHNIMQLASSLKSQLTKDEFLYLDQTMHRLLSPEQMGHLFKVLTLTSYEKP